MNHYASQQGQFSWVYVLTNPAMPGLVKIGRTSQPDVKVRVEQLYSTGVPLPFDIHFVCRVPNSVEVEKALHIAFGPHRVNASREFFKIEPEQARVILELLHVDDVTAEVESQPTSLDPQSIAAGKQYGKKRPRFNFGEMQIPVGSTLACTVGAATVVVVGPRKVKLDGEELLLSVATRRVLGLNYNVAPSPYWIYDGRLLRDIYNDTYGLPEDE